MAGRTRRPAAPPTAEDIADASSSLWVPREWWEELHKVRERDARAFEDGIRSVELAILGSGTLRRLASSTDSQDRHRGWLCVLALVDVFIDPQGCGLPNRGGYAATSIAVPLDALVCDPVWDAPWRHGWVSKNTAEGRAIADVVEDVTARANALRTEATALHEACEREHGGLIPDGVISGGDKVEEFRRRYQLVGIQDVRARALAAAAGAMMNVVAELPRVYERDAGAPAVPWGQLATWLDFVLRTDTDLRADKPARERLIADVVSDCFRDTVKGTLQKRREKVRSYLKNQRAASRAEHAEEVARRDRSSGSDDGLPVTAWLSFSRSRLQQEGFISEGELEDVLHEPTGAGVRVIVSLPKHPG